MATIKPLLEKKKNIVVQNSSTTFYASSGKQIASLACIDPKITGLVQKGIEAFSSLIGHRLLRWQIRTGFESWIQRKEDPRLICTTGGYEGIAGLIGCSGSHKAISIVKSLLYAQAYARFSFHDGSHGNMILLREAELHRNGEPSKINIILGEFLLPNYTHVLPKGEKRRLIPIPALPPLIGSHNTHAAQALLQLLILEEFSDQSIIFAGRGDIELPIQAWTELASEAGLPRSILGRVIEEWANRNFLNQICNDRYSLGGSYLLEAEFLRCQGQMRRQGRKAAVADLGKTAKKQKKF
jgi:hypothetical protein